MMPVEDTDGASCSNGSRKNARCTIWLLRTRAPVFHRWMSVDRAALARLYDQFGGLVFRRARRLLGDESLARDVCHDVFVEILRSHPDWDPVSPVGWLYTTTTNKCLNVLRREQRAGHAVAIRRHWATPAATAELSLRLLLRGLPEPLQEIAIYYGVDEMKQEEIALALGVSQKTVSNRIREIRALLQGPDEPCEQEAK
jgi:RNA polymerase sigma-70 factor (ECF subfamily)